MSNVLQNLYISREEYENYFNNYRNELYKSVSYDDNFIDLYGPRKMYGRRDSFGNLVVPRRERVKYFDKNGDVIFAFPFVFDAFVDFYNFYERERVKRNWEKYIEDYSRVSFTLPQDAYRDMIKRKLDRFVETNKNKKMFKFISFYDFVEMFREQNSFLTFEEFIVSSLNNYRSTGLIITTNSHHFLNDLEQYNINNYLKKEEYKFFLESARRFGFLVDIHIPWRIVFDLNSYASSYYVYRREALEGVKGASKEIVNQFLEDFSLTEDGYMKKHGKINLEKFFNDYYLVIGDDSFGLEIARVEFLRFYKLICSDFSITLEEFRKVLNV